MKIIKLILIAAVLVGSIVGLTLYLNPDSEQVSDNEFKSEQANKWKQKIDNLCKEGNWSKTNYESISSGIKTDNATDKDLLSDDEERSLQRYLFATSCSYVQQGADALFKCNVYPADKVTHFDNAANYLKVKIAEMGANSNLAKTLNLYSAYRQLLALLSYKTKTAVWSHPLRAYTGSSSDGIKKRILGMSYYKSYFSNNSSIRNRVSRLSSEGNSSEDNYYMELERCIEHHYNSTQDNSQLLDDQIWFSEHSTNGQAINRLNKFTN